MTSEEQRMQPEDVSPVEPLELDDIEPVLVESLSNLIDRFGAAGIRNVLDLLCAREANGGEDTDDPA